MTKYTSATTSNADKVIDALTEVQKELNKVQPYACNNCGSGNYEVRTPLGGHKIKVCTNCGSKLFSATTSHHQLLGAQYTHDQGSSRGPTKTNNKPDQSDSDKLQHSFRTKGKSRD